jgi:hypothetical protein
LTQEGSQQLWTDKWSYLLTAEEYSSTTLSHTHFILKNNEEEKKSKISTP